MLKEGREAEKFGNCRRISHSPSHRQATQPAHLLAGTLGNTIGTHPTYHYCTASRRNGNTFRMMGVSVIEDPWAAGVTGLHAVLQSPLARPPGKGKESGRARQAGGACRALPVSSVGRQPCVGEARYSRNDAPGARARLTATLLAPRGMNRLPTCGKPTTMTRGPAPGGEPSRTNSRRRSPGEAYSRSTRGRYTPGSIQINSISSTAQPEAQSSASSAWKAIWTSLMPA